MNGHRRLPGSAAADGMNSGVCVQLMGSASQLAAEEREVLSVPSQKTSTVGQTIALLRLLAKAPAPLGVNAISRELNFAPSSCFRILKQLTEAGFAQFDPRTKCYTLGVAAAMLGRRALDPANTFAMIRPELEAFTERTQTSMGFWRRIDRKRIILAGFVESPNPMRIHLSVGQRLPLFIGAVGRAFAAELGLSDAELQEEFSQLRWQSAPDLAEYIQQVREYRRTGYTIDPGHFAPGVTTVATVLRDAVGGRTFGLSAIRISGHMTDSEFHAIGGALVELKRQLTEGWLGRI